MRKKSLPKGIKNTLRAVFDLTKSEEDENRYFSAKRIFQRGRGTHGFQEFGALWKDAEHPLNEPEIKVYLEVAVGFEYIDAITIETTQSGAKIRESRGYRVIPEKVSELEEMFGGRAR